MVRDEPRTSCAKTSPRQSGTRSDNAAHSAGGKEAFPDLESLRAGGSFSELADVRDDRLHIVLRQLGKGGHLLRNPVRLSALRHHAGEELVVSLLEDAAGEVLRRRVQIGGFLSVALAGRAMTLRAFAVVHRLARRRSRGRG